MSLLLDSSILVKLVINEPGSDSARTRVKDSLEKECTVFTVDLALAEAINALWKHVNIHGDLAEVAGEQAVEDLLNIWKGLNVIPSQEIIEEAFKNAIQNNITAYDSLFIAASAKTMAKLYTADGRLFEASRKIVASELLS